MTRYYIIVIFTIMLSTEFMCFADEYDFDKLQELGERSVIKQDLQGSKNESMDSLQRQHRQWRDEEDAKINAAKSSASSLGSSPNPPPCDKTDTCFEIIETSGSFTYIRCIKGYKTNKFSKECISYGNGTWFASCGAILNLNIKPDFRSAGNYVCGY